MRLMGARAAALLLVAVACTASRPEPSGTTTPSTASASSGNTASRSPSRAFALPPPSTGARSADAVRTRLCVRPPAPKPTPAHAEATPAAIVQTESEVQQVRGLKYEHPVAVDPVTHRELVHGLDESFDHSYPVDMMHRRSLAWTTVGVVPDGTNLRDAVHGFLSSQVIGYYDPSSGQLVFIGTANPSPLERFTLAHELTHADDDQHFDLSRISDLEDACDDEGEMASLGSVEGSAVYFSLQVARQFFSASDLAKLAAGGGGSQPEGVPPFVQSLEEWPYIDGPRFIATLQSEGGLDEVNESLKRFPVSTEQVIHPEKFPGDRPIRIDAPDLGPALGPAWKDLDVMDIGEEWLREALALRLDRNEASTAADGWGGAQYRAWTDGSHVAVMLETAWDTPRDAGQFLDAMGAWIGQRRDASVGPVAGDPARAVALFASDAATLTALEAALR
jgi:hypothetical protein